jgi:hypothetical protein
MQLPTSISSNNYSSPVSNRSSSNPSNNRSTESTRATTEPASVERNKAENSVEAQTDNRPEARFSAVDQPQQSDKSSQDLIARESTEQSTGNNGTDQYRQISREGANDAQTQDPSLFRVDVYV